MRKLAIGLIAFTVFSFGSVRARAEGSKDSRYLICLHGRNVQVEQSERPQHSRYGFYEIEKILDTFRERGFVVTGESRSKEAGVSDSADKVVAQVHKLLESGVAADHITVVGGSMGGSIALMAATRLQNADVRFATLGVCLSRTARARLFGEKKASAGHVLSIREASDETTMDCPKSEDDPAGAGPQDRGLRDPARHRPPPRLPLPAAARVGGLRRGVGDDVSPIAGKPLPPIPPCVISQVKPEGGDDMIRGINPPVLRRPEKR